MAPPAMIPCAISSRISSLLMNIFLSTGLSVHTLADGLIDAPPNGGRVHASPLVLPNGDACEESHWTLGPGVSTIGGNMLNRRGADPNRLRPAEHRSGKGALALNLEV
jgi:hypothetical protein